jgi:hypothetical protein
MGAMIRATVSGHPSAVWACTMVLGFSLLFIFLNFLIFRKSAKEALERGSKLPFVEDQS